MFCIFQDDLQLACRTAGAGEARRAERSI